MDTHRAPAHVVECPHSLLLEQTAHLSRRWRHLLTAARGAARATAREKRITLALHRRRTALAPVDTRRELDFAHA